MISNLNRRNALKQAAAVASLVWSSSTSAHADTFDPGIGDATDALLALSDRKISATELVEHAFARIGKFNEKINAFVTLLEEAAMARAKQADAASSKGEKWGPLHGLPILVKDLYETAGIKTTCGATEMSAYIPTTNATAVERLLKAGAIIIGKTNVPKFGADFQSFNSVAGTTNNPWNLERTSGGSTGGGAAALAAGIGFLELGSDMGGSIRTPSHFCGVYGLKPTVGIVPSNGHIPPLPGQVDFLPDLAVCGPLARSARDLKLELEIVAEPTNTDSKAYSYQLPKPRHDRLGDYKIGFVLDDPFCSVSTESKTVLADAIAKLQDAGCQLTEGWPKGVDPSESFGIYSQLLAAKMSSSSTDAERKALANLPQDHIDFSFAKNWESGLSFSHRDWLAHDSKRIAQRNLWKKYFQEFDLFLMPTACVTAFPHDHNPNQLDRVLKTSVGDKPYSDMLAWVHFSSLSGNPAVVAPVGQASDDLPVGLQIMGPYLEDATPIHFAELMGPVTGMFKAPPGFDL